MTTELPNIDYHGRGTTVTVEYRTEKGEELGVRYRWGGSIYVDIIAGGSAVDVLNVSDEIAAFEARFGHRPSAWELARIIDFDALALPAEAEAEDEAEYVAEYACPACGEPSDYCLGHGDIGDPEGAAILADHDNGGHGKCHPSADCE